MAEQDDQIETVIPARPQIAVELNEHDEIVISTAFIGNDFRTVEHGEVVIPIGDANEVILAMQNIVRARGR